ncbi:hypothetical protein Fcan01_26593 [Folsomia candida]|uniref:Uncharacterized protein n=1 Tax=Folsomia candida TaxID=158441 RepID=A0A226D0F8_FOLCA|nr:hypothetical protein Fcan01_26593 [Folsomia candida]
MKPFQKQTIKFFNKLYSKHVIFKYKLPVQLEVLKNGTFHAEKSKNMATIIVPLLLGLFATIVLGLAIWLKLLCPVTPFVKFTIGGWIWCLAMVTIFIFVYAIFATSYANCMLHSVNMTDRYVEELGQAVPAQFSATRGPTLLDYILHTIVRWALTIYGMIIFAATLLNMDPTYTVLSWAFKTFPVSYNLLVWLAFENTALLNVTLIMVRFVTVYLTGIDVVRGFILVAVLALMGVPLFRNLIDFCDTSAELNTVGHRDVQVFRNVTLLHGIPAQMNQIASSVTLIMVTLSAVFFAYVIVRLLPTLPPVVVPLEFIGLFISVYVAVVVCDYGAYVHEKSANLLAKFRAKMGNMRQGREGRILARNIKSLRPIGLHVGVGETRLFILDKDKKIWVLNSMLDYSVDAVMAY